MLIWGLYEARNPVWQSLKQIPRKTHHNLGPWSPREITFSKTTSGGFLEVTQIHRLVSLTNCFWPVVMLRSFSEFTNLKQFVISILLSVWTSQLDLISLACFLQATAQKLGYKTKRYSNNFRVPCMALKLQPYWPCWLVPRHSVPYGLESVSLQK